MDNSLLSLKKNSENKFKNNENDNLIMNYTIGILINILLFINYNNIYINLVLFVLLYSIICGYLILEKNILNKEINNILIFIFILTFTYDLLNIFHYDKNKIFFILLNINLICIK